MEKDKYEIYARGPNKLVINTCLMMFNDFYDRGNKNRLPGGKHIY